MNYSMMGINKIQIYIYKQKSQACLSIKLELRVLIFYLFKDLLIFSISINSNKVYHSFK